MQDCFSSTALASPVNLMTVTNIDIRHPYFIPDFIIALQRLAGLAPFYRHRKALAQNGLFSHSER